MKKETQEKLKRIYTQISGEKKPAKFFAAFLNPLILKEKNIEKWDILYSASWFRDFGTRKDYEYVFSKFIKEFNADELSVFLEKLILVDVKDSILNEIVSTAGIVEDSVVTLEPFTFKDGKKTMSVPKVIIFASTPPPRKVGKTKKPLLNEFPKSKGISQADTPNALGKIKKSAR